jgi:hypothetical protein
MAILVHLLEQSCLTYIGAAGDSCIIQCYPLLRQRHSWTERFAQFTMSPQISP